MSRNTESDDELAAIDLYDFDLFQTGKVHEAFRALRERAPLYWHESESGQEPFWSVTKWDDIRSISRDPKLFTSTRGVQLGDSMGEELPPNLLTTDPPDHTALRKITAGRFRPALVRSLQSAIDSTCRELVDDMLQRDSCEFVGDVTSILPMHTICSLFGIPRSDWGLIFDLQNRAVGSNDPEFNPELLDPTSDAFKLGIERATEARIEMAAYFAALAGSKIENGCQDDDLITVLVNAGLEADVFVTYCFLVVVAGNETTRTSLTGGTAALIEHPSQYRGLAENNSLMNPAIEEMIRWVTPVVHFMRVATEDVEMRGRTIREGDKLALWYLSGNRDEDAFTNAFDFRIDRSPNEHVGFGYGEHFCLGAHLARLQMSCFFTYLLEEGEGDRVRQAPREDALQLPRGLQADGNRVPPELTSNDVAQHIKEALR